MRWKEEKALYEWFNVEAYRSVVYRGYGTACIVIKEKVSKRSKKWKVTVNAPNDQTIHVYDNCEKAAVACIETHERLTCGAPGLVASLKIDDPDMTLGTAIKALKKVTPKPA